MKAFYELKREALNSLKGNWPIVLIATFIIFVINVICQFNPYIAIASLLVLPSLSFGLIYFTMDLGRNGNADLNNMIVAFNKKYDYVQILVLFIMYTLIVLLWTLLFVIPGIYKSLCYTFAFNVKADNPDMDWRDVLKESQDLIDGHKWRYFLFSLSFIGWFILGSITVVGNLFVIPYYQMASYKFYQELIDIKKGPNGYQKNLIDENIETLEPIESLETEKTE